MKKTSDDVLIVSALLGAPIFCVGRIYSRSKGGNMIRDQYIFKFDNGFGVSVIEFIDKSFSNNHDYEVAVLEMNNTEIGYSITYDTSLTGNIERGDADFVEDFLNRAEAL